MIKTVNGWVLVKKLEADGKSPGGIYVQAPESCIWRGEVLDVSDGGEHPCPVDLLSVIIFHEDAAVEIPENGVIFYAVKSEDIIGYSYVVKDA